MGVVEVASSVGTSKNMNSVEISEKKRLSSLKQKKEAFKTKEQLVREALSNIDNNAKKNKIVFDDDVGVTEVPVKKKKKGVTLFDDDTDVVETTKEKKKNGLTLFDDDEAEDLPEDYEFKIKKNVNEKLAKMQMNYANDKRFVLDERFIEDDDEGNEDNKDDKDNESKNEKDNVEDDSVSDIKNEKDWQLNILENVLGVPIKKKEEKTQKPVTTSKMIRYDPTESEHQIYEINVKEAKAKTKTKKKEKRKEVEEVEESKPAPISKDVYYSVSDKFTESFKEPQSGFSLLKTFGQNEENTSRENDDYTTVDVPSKDKKFKFTFDEKNPFKYDSSDDEDETDKLINGKQESNVVNETTNEDNLFSTNEQCFFFNSNDSRFKDAFKFFNKEATSFEGFNKLRCELKQIVRAKIRNNIRRNEKCKGKVKKPTSKKSKKSKK